MELYFEDLSAGMVFTSRTVTLDQPEMIAFAEKYDPQPFHVDPVAAQKLFFGGLAASGWYTGSVATRLLVESLPLAGGIIGAGGQLEWRLPARPGDTLQLTVEILELTPSRTKPDRGRAVIRCTSRNQHGEIVHVFTSTLVVLRQKL